MSRFLSPSRDWGGDYLVYVLNASKKGHLAGFHLDSSTCDMEYIHDSVVVLQPDLEQIGELPFVFASPSQLSFAPDNDHLVVNIKRPMNGQENVPGHLVVYRVKETGCLDDPVPNESNGNTPWAFAIGPHQKLISTEFNGPGFFESSHLSSYEPGDVEGTLVLDKTIILENDESRALMAMNIAYVSELWDACEAI